MKNIHLPSLVVGVLGASALSLLLSFRPVHQSAGQYGITIGDSSDEVFVIDTTTGETWRRMYYGADQGTLADYCRGPHMAK